MARKGHGGLANPLGETYLTLDLHGLRSKGDLGSRVASETQSYRATQAQDSPEQIGENIYIL